jgi:hypothetical protein
MTNFHTTQGVTYFCTDSVGNVYTRYSARHIKAEYTFASLYRREGTTHPVEKAAVSYSRSRQNAANYASRLHGVEQKRSWDPETRTYVDDPHRFVAEVMDVRAYPGRHKVEPSAVGLLESQATRANTGFSEWWKLLNEELEKLGTLGAEFGDARGCYEMGESPSTAAASLLAVREG